MSTLDFISATPFFVIVFGAISILILGLFRDDKLPFPRLWWGAGLCVATWVAALPYLDVSGVAFDGMVYVDRFSFVLFTLILGGGAFTFLLSDDKLEEQRVSSSVDIDTLILLAITGGMVMVCAANLIVLFVGFELLSLSVYVLTGAARMEKASAEGALKYLILGAFTSAFLLYGMTLIYGATGTMYIPQIAAAASQPTPLLLIGIGLMVFGFGFKVSLVPFHYWTPDVYQGAPVSIAGFMAVVVKAAAFGAFLRVMYFAFGSINESWVGLFWLMALITMTVGNVIALRQRSIKRLLAYSSIAHAGYALMGFLVTSSPDGAQATLFYLFVYSLMTVAAFGVVVVASAGTDSQYESDDLSSLSGLGWNKPFVGIAMAVAMLSLAGMPPLAGFMGKFYLFNAVIQGGYVGLAIVAGINSVISLYYYLRVIVVMYFSEERDSETQPAALQGVYGPQIALAVTTLALVYIGLFSAPWFAMAGQAVHGLG